MRNSIRNMKDRKSVRIAIVGCGPKGLYGFERLAASFKKNPPNIPVTIDIYNRSPYFGAGDVYHPGQASCLLINNPVGEINMWIEEDPPPVVSNPLRCVEWLQNQGENMGEGDYVSRAKVGQYLNFGFQGIANNLPKNVHGNDHIASVTDINKTDGCYELTFQPKDSVQETSECYDHILLATGHPKPRLAHYEQEILKRSNRFKTGGFVPFIYPVQENLGNIKSRSSVAIKGLGLTFIDAVLALTEGRGGEFYPAGNDKLKYRPSGEEPSVIFPFSRSGIPMIPRNSTCNDTPLKFFTRKNLNHLCKNSFHSKVDFTSQLLPFLKQEMIYSFYSVQMKQREFPADLSCCSSFEEVEYLIKKFHDEFPEASPFDCDSFLYPIQDYQFKNAEQLHSFIYNYQSFYVREAIKGERKSGWAAASSVWRKMTPLFNEIYSFGGLTPTSHQEFDKFYRTKLNRVTFGPPVETGRKLLALQEAGILDYGVAIQPDISIHEQQELFNIYCAETDTHKSVDYLIDARIPKLSIPENSSLYRNMLKRGLLSVFENRAEKNSYRPGSPAISKEGYAINADGKIERGILITGTPTEGITFDNDSLSRNRNNFVSRWADSISKRYKNRSVIYEIS